MITDEDVIKMMRLKHNMLIGERTAEETLNELKRRLADIKVAVRGRELSQGLPKTVEVSAADLLEI